MGENRPEADARFLKFAAGTEVFKIRVSGDRKRRRDLFEACAPDRFAGTDNGRIERGEKYADVRIGARGTGREALSFEGRKRARRIAYVRGQPRRFGRGLLRRGKREKRAQTRADSFENYFKNAKKSRGRIGVNFFRKRKLPPL